MRTSAADTRRARGTWLRLALLALLVVLALVPATTDVTHSLLTDTTTTTGVVSTLPEFPAYERSTGDVVDLMTTRLYAAVDTMRAARDQADADILRLAIDASATLGLSKPVMRIGDSGLFAAVLDALDLDPPWRRRLGHAFGDPKRLRALLCREAEDGAGALDATLAGLSPTRIRRKVEEMFAASGLGVTGRTPAEVATRYAEKAVLAAGVGARPAEVLTRFLDISGAPATAATALAALARDEKLAIGPALDRFTARLDAFADRGIASEKLTFATEFGRRLDYYTGFMFEILATPKARKPVIGGGRYDRLVSVLARLRHETAVTVPAVGFSIWLDRVEGRPS